MGGYWGLLGTPAIKSLLSGHVERVKELITSFPEANEKLLLGKVTLPEICETEQPIASQFTELWRLVELGDHARQ
ncbi:MAG: hypothetical protein CVU57_01160 [Deltaproteobacteria bacterium HGW-Deltaproteobacteria-15]|jgi:hypothetical protein|nr:MAG: hypothetical protein CVU57_01160 [Deltaproteobacteria bacterium HGW-Deltaproteobacteria-15]